MGSTAPRRIDFHHHFASPAWTALLESHDILSPPWRTWSPATSIEAMDRSGTQTSMLSITTPGVWLADRGIGDSDDARRLARDTNDHGARLVSDHASRFGMFASLPLPHIDDSLREIEHAFDVRSSIAAAPSSTFIPPFPAAVAT